MPNPIAFLIFFLMPSLGFSQVFGGNPTRTDWKYLPGKNATLIFPNGQEEKANRISQLILAINNRTDSSIGGKRKPVPIVLQPGTTISNGYVALAPYRSEFYLTPPANPFDFGNLSWTDQLTLHEYRHVEQYSNFNIGGSKVLRVLLGEQGQALGNALTVPDWFFEGDAVYQETQLSQQGRGRAPSFFEGYRAIWDAGIQYSFMKLRNGSLKNFVPDHYDLGYLLIAFGHDRYEPAFWQHVAEDAAAMKGIFYPFQKAIKRYSGISYSTFVNNSLAEARKNLGYKISGQNKPQLVIDRENPVHTERGELLYLKSSYKKVPAFYLSSGAKEQKIRTKDRSLDHYFSYANNKILYASYRPDLRWGWIDYCELQILDLQTGKQNRISKRSRYFSPSLSKTGDSIIAVQVPVNGRQQLHLIDSTGHLLNVLPNDSNLVYFHPSFWKNKIAVSVMNEHGQMNLLAIDPQNGQVSSLLPWSSYTIGFPSSHGDTLYFTMSYKEQNRIMAYDGKSRQVFELKLQGQKLQTGKYQPSVYGQTLAFAIFKVSGYEIVKEAINQLEWLPVDDFTTNPVSDFGVNSLEKKGNELSQSSVHQQADSKGYRKTTRFFNFHSWQPYYEDPEFTFSLIGQNVLNTFQSELYGKYNTNEGFKQVGYTGVYGGFFPFIKGDINYTFDRRGIFENRTIYWNQLQTSIGLSVPLNLSRGRSISFLKAGSDLVFNQDYFKEPEKSKLGNTAYWYFDHDLVFSHQVQQARQEFNPRFAQTVHLNFRHTLNLFNSKQLLEAVNLYFPGFFPNHSFVINLAAQQRDSTKGIRFSNDIPFARGYANENFYRATKWGINYQLPICYPDLGAWNIIYVLRIRTNVFYDQAMAKDPQLFAGKSQEMFRSIGNELFFDTKWWNQLPISFGIRYSRLLDDDIYGGSGKNRWQFILPVNLIPGGVNSKRKYFF